MAGIGASYAAATSQSAAGHGGRSAPVPGEPFYVGLPMLWAVVWESNDPGRLCSLAKNCESVTRRVGQSCRQNAGCRRPAGSHHPSQGREAGHRAVMRLQILFVDPARIPAPFRPGYSECQFVDDMVSPPSSSEEKLPPASVGLLPVCGSQWKSCTPEVQAQYRVSMAEVRTPKHSYPGARAFRFLLNWIMDRR